MKTNAEFTNDVLQKYNKKRRKMRIIKSIVAITVTFAFILPPLINIFSFDFTFNSNAYKRYMSSYASADNQTSLKIINASDAVFMLNSKHYYCSLSNNNSNKFTLTHVYAEEQTKDILNVVFSSNSAKVSGKLNNQQINQTLTTVTDLNCEQGLWTMFAMNSGNGIVAGDKNWFLIDEENSYAGEGAMAYKCEFVNVGDKTLLYMKDQISGLVEISLIENLPIEEFGFPVLKKTLYEYENDTEGFVAYYKKGDENSNDFAGKSFSTSLITYSCYTEPMQAQQLNHFAGIKWRAFAIDSVEEAFVDNVSLNLTLNDDKSVNFSAKGNFLNFNSSGNWFAISDYVLVVLNKKMPNFNLQAFCICPDNQYTDSKEVENNARSYLSILYGYKTGLYTSNYYMTDIIVDIYWGNSYTKENFLEQKKQKFLYNTEYVLSTAKVTIIQTNNEIKEYNFIPTYNISLIFKENPTAPNTDPFYELYKNGFFVSKSLYHLSQNKDYLHFNSSLTIEYQNLSDVFNEDDSWGLKNQFTQINGLRIDNKKLYNFGFTFNYNGDIYEYVLEFTVK